VRARSVHAAFKRVLFKKYRVDVIIMILACDPPFGAHLLMRMINNCDLDVKNVYRKYLLMYMQNMS